NDALDEQSKTPLALDQRLMRCLALADVAHDPGKTGQPPGRVANRLQEGRGPEPAPVLADPPPFRLAAALRLRLLQQPPGASVRLILGGEKHAVILSEDLAWCVLF